MSDLIRKPDPSNKGVESFQVKVLKIILAPKWRVILQGSLFEDEISQRDKSNWEFAKSIGAMLKSSSHLALPARGS